MKKICALFLSLVFILGLAVSPVFGGGDKVRGEKGNGGVVQDLCGPDDECEGDPYWW